jgi:hypothetical protein
MNTMGWILRYLCNFVGGMLAAAALVLVYVYLLGAPHLPRLPIVGLPHTYVALVLILAWAIVQGYVSFLGVVVDGFFSLFGLRRPPGALMALGHGFTTTAALLLLAWHYRPDAPSATIALFIPLGIHAAVRLIAGRVPDERDSNKGP